MRKVFKKYTENFIEDEKESDLDREIRHLLGSLPVYAKKDEIIDAIKVNQVCVVQGETGYFLPISFDFSFYYIFLFFFCLRSGKSTQLPQYLVEAGLNYVVRNGQRKRLKIAVTQPRRNAVSLSLLSYYNLLYH
jgi:HrpA-like RNA helicase